MSWECPECECPMVPLRDPTTDETPAACPKCDDLGEEQAIIRAKQEQG